MRKLVLLLAGLVWVVSALPSAASPATCPGTHRTCAEAAVRTYLASLTDPSEVARIPLASDVRRFENGINTGSSADAIRKTLANEYLLVQRVDDVSMFADTTGEAIEVFVRYLVQTHATHPATVHVMERFRYLEGQISEIDAVLCIAAGAYEGSRNDPPAELPDNQGLAGIVGGAICLRSLSAAGSVTS